MDAVRNDALIMFRVDDVSANAECIRSETLPAHVPYKNVWCSGSQAFHQHSEDPAVVHSGTLERPLPLALSMSNWRQTAQYLETQLPNSRVQRRRGLSCVKLSFQM
jgi:hypothetical protein